MTVPVMLALTMSTRPAFRATRAMINSVAFPKRAFNRAPMEGPSVRDSSSVAVLSRIARGMIDRIEAMKTNQSPQWNRSAAAATGSIASRPRAMRRRGGMEGRYSLTHCDRLLTAGAMAESVHPSDHSGMDRPQLPEPS